MNASIVTVESGQIRVLPSFADMLVVKRLGGRFAGASRAWIWPATRENALLLSRHLRQAHATPEFGALLSGAQPLKKSDPRLWSEATGPEISGEVGVPVAAPEFEVPEIAPEMEVPETPAEPLPEALPKPPEPEPEMELPDGLVTRPWRHQLAAFKFVLDHFALGFFGLLLAMGMGTGKTLVACMLALHLRARRVLIACPLRVVPVWMTQFERHVSAPVVIVGLDEDFPSVARKREHAAEKMKLAEVLGVPFIAVINYDSAWREPFVSWAERIRWDLLIADEAHRIKTPGGKASLFFKRMRLRATHRIALTGTPMPHGPMDIYAIFRYLDVTIFGPSFSAFRTKYAVMGGYQRKQITGFQRLDELEALMSKVTFKVGDEVLDLPPATEVTYHCALTGEAARIYKDLEEDFVARVKDGTVTAANAMVKLLRLQQVTGGCVPTDDHTIHRVDSSKQRLLADTLEDIGSEEPVVVFCRFTADLLAVHEICREMGLTSLELSGKRDELERWQGGEAQVLAVQIDAGSEGVDFTRARYSIFYSVGFSLGKYDQAKKRTHRPGQIKPVTHIHLVARGTVDVKIMRALEKRADIVNAILAEIKN